MDSEEIDNAIAVELLNNQTDDDLSLRDAERQTAPSAGGCFAFVVLIVIVAVVASA